VLCGSIALALRAVARTAVAPEAAVAAGPLLGPKVRVWYRSTVAPFEEALARAGLSPDMLTYAQLGVSVLAGWAFATGCIFLGGTLTCIAGTLDVLDGGLARRRGVDSKRGAFIDSVTDRWAEAATFIGLGVYFRDGWVLLLVALAALSSQMVSYTRARAEGLGLTVAMGGAQRPERYVLLGFGAGFSGLASHLACPVVGGPQDVVLIGALALLVVVATWTALQRARYAARAFADADAARKSP
jgi:CDP-diacylglycerol--glycerol-3-phosphate 3-phosphatidyltransferase